MAEEQKNPLMMERVADSIDWVKEHSTNILYTLATLIGVLLVSSHFLGNEGGKSADFKVSNLFNELSKEKETGKILSKLDKPLRNNAELQGKYDALIVQKLIEKHSDDSLDPYVSRVFKRVGGQSGYYEDFSKTTLLINNKEFAAALSHAKALKEQMEKDLSFWETQETESPYGSFLYAYNLLRIASLEYVAGSPQSELKAIEELQKNAGWGFTPIQAKWNNPESYSLLEESFREQSISLSDYLKHRKDELSSSLQRG